MKELSNIKPQVITSISNHYVTIIQNLFVKSNKISKNKTKDSIFIKK